MKNDNVIIYYLLFLDNMHNISTKDTCTGSIITQGGAI